MNESGKPGDERPDVQEEKTNYRFEWWAMVLAFFVMGCLPIIKCRVTPQDSAFAELFSSIAMLTFAMVVIAIIDARKHDRANFHNAIIKKAEADRAKLENEAEDRRCEMAMKKNEQPNAILCQSNGMITIVVSFEHSDEGKHSKKTESPRPKTMDCKSEHVDNG